MKKGPFKFKLAASKPAVDVAGGTIREAQKKDFPKLDGLAIFLLVLKPGAVRIPHWHPDANELDYILEGRAAIAIIAGHRETKNTKDETQAGIRFETSAKKTCACW